MGLVGKWKNTFEVRRAIKITIQNAKFVSLIYDEVTSMDNAKLGNCAWLYYVRLVSYTFVVECVTCGF
jgi:hypothetical protein